MISHFVFHSFTAFLVFGCLSVHATLRSCVFSGHGHVKGWDESYATFADAGTYRLSETSRVVVDIQISQCSSYTTMPCLTGTSARIGSTTLEQLNGASSAEIILPNGQRADSLTQNTTIGTDQLSFIYQDALIIRQGSLEVAFGDGFVVIKDEDALGSLDGLCNIPSSSEDVTFFTWPNQAMSTHLRANIPSDATAQFSEATPIVTSDVELPLLYGNSAVAGSNEANTIAQDACDESRIIRSRQTTCRTYLISDVLLGDQTVATGTALAYQIEDSNSILQAQDTEEQSSTNSSSAAKTWILVSCGIVFVLIIGLLLLRRHVLQRKRNVLAQIVAGHIDEPWEFYKQDDNPRASTFFCKLKNMFKGDGTVSVMATEKV